MKALNKKPKLKKNKDRALAYGEVTGHAHRADVNVYEREDGLREFSGPAKISHEEHKQITVPANDYLSGQVVEFNYFSMMEQTVKD